MFKMAAHALTRGDPHACRVCTAKCNRSVGSRDDQGQYTWARRPQSQKCHATMHASAVFLVATTASTRQVRKTWCTPFSAALIAVLQPNTLPYVDPRGNYHPQTMGMWDRSSRNCIPKAVYIIVLRSPVQAKAGHPRLSTNHCQNWRQTLLHCVNHEGQKPYFAPTPQRRTCRISQGNTLDISLIAGLKPTPNSVDSLTPQQRLQLPTSIIHIIHSALPTRKAPRPAIRALFPAKWKNPGTSGHHRYLMWRLWTACMRVCVMPKYVANMMAVPTMAVKDLLQHIGISRPQQIKGFMIQYHVALLEGARRRHTQHRTLLLQALEDKGYHTTTSIARALLATHRLLPETEPPDASAATCPACGKLLNIRKTRLRCKHLKCRACSSCAPKHICTAYSTQVGLDMVPWRYRHSLIRGCVPPFERINIHDRQCRTPPGLQHSPPRAPRVSTAPETKQHPSTEQRNNPPTRMPGAVETAAAEFMREWDTLHSGSASAAKAARQDRRPPPATHQPPKTRRPLSSQTAHGHAHSRTQLQHLGSHTPHRNQARNQRNPRSRHQSKRGCSDKTDRRQNSPSKRRRAQEKYTPKHGRHQSKRGRSDRADRCSDSPSKRCRAQQKNPPKHGSRHRVPRQ
jgi:hypothetical protein